VITTPAATAATNFATLPVPRRGPGLGSDALVGSGGRGAQRLTAAAIAVVLAVTNNQRQSDDAMITFRYAKNLAHGSGFVFNPGEKVLSTTSPLTGLVYSAVDRVGLSPQRVSIVLAAVFLPWCAYIVGREFATAGWHAAAWAALIGIPFTQVLVVDLTNEMPAYLLASVGALWFVVRRRDVAALPLAAVTVLIRPDGVVLLAVVFAVAAVAAARDRARRRPFVLGSVIAGATLAGFALAGLVIFGSPLPVTLAAKRAQHEAGLGSTYPDLLTGTLQTHLGSWWNRPSFGLALVGLVVLAVWGRSLVHTLVPLLLAWVALFALAFTVSGTTSYTWYASPVVLGYWVVVALGVQGILKALTRVHLPRPVGVTAAVAGVLLVVLSAGGTMPEDLDAPPYRTDLYRPAADWLRANTPVDASVGTPEVGIIGFYADRRIIDFAGLIQPDVPAHYDRDLGFEGFATYAFRRYHPDYVVLIHGWFPDLTALPQFRSTCTVATTITRPGLAGGDSLDIFRCTRPAGGAG
jgi:hypothetical protein